MIKFLGAIDDDYCIKYEQLPQHANLIDDKLINKFGFGAGVIGVIFGFLVLLWKQYACNNGVFPLRRNMIVVGCIIGVMMLGIHEILHLLPYPKTANKFIAINNGKPVSFCNVAITKNKFVLSSFLPILLGILPIFLFIFLPNVYKGLNTILWTCGTIGLGAAGNDYIETLIVYHYLLPIVVGIIVSKYKHSFLRRSHETK